MDRRIEVLDYIRFAAAIMVVLYHYTFNGIVNGKILSLVPDEGITSVTRYGYLGVELFFMISGYVIFFTAKSKDAGEFAVLRLIRLYPAYWFAVITTGMIGWFIGNDLMKVDLRQVLVNLTMIQPLFNVDHVDGVYWTLFIELKFYLLIFFVLLLKQQRYLNTMFILWPFYILTALLTKSMLPYAGSYYCFFSVGALFAIIKGGRTWLRLISLLIAFGLCLHTSIGHATEITIFKSHYVSPWVVGVIIFCFAMLFVLSNHSSVKQWKLPFSATLGGLSYTLYLHHAHVGYMVINKIMENGSQIMAYTSAVILVVILAYFNHKFIEVKLKVFWKRLFMNSIGRWFIYSAHRRKVV